MHRGGFPSPMPSHAAPTLSSIEHMAQPLQVRLVASLARERSGRAGGRGGGGGGGGGAASPRTLAEGLGVYRGPGLHSERRAAVAQLQGLAPPGGAEEAAAPGASECGWGPSTLLSVVDPDQWEMPAARAAGAGGEGERSAGSGDRERALQLQRIAQLCRG